MQSELKTTQPEILSADTSKVTFPASESGSIIVSSLQDDVSMKEIPREEFNNVQLTIDDDIADKYDAEVAEAKLRLLLRF